MSYRKGWLILSFIFLTAFVACSVSLGPEAEDKKYYVLEGDYPGLVEFGQPLEQNLRVRETEAGRFVNSQRIIFSKNDRSRGYYQFAYWVDPPPKRIGMLLESYLERVGIFSAVFRESSGVPADFELRTEILDFRHHIASSPGEVVVSINAELVSLVDREIVAKKNFTVSKNVADFNAEGAIEAFSLASNEVLNLISTWVGSQFRSIQLPSSSQGLLTETDPKF